MGNSLDSEFQSLSTETILRHFKHCQGSELSHFSAHVPLQQATSNPRDCPLTPTANLHPPSLECEEVSLQSWIGFQWSPLGPRAQSWPAAAGCGAGLCQPWVLLPQPGSQGIRGKIRMLSLKGKRWTGFRVGRNSRAPS